MSLVEPTQTPSPLHWHAAEPMTRDDLDRMPDDGRLKFSRFEAAGCAAYWVVDPDTPSLIAWELRDGAYTQVAKVTGTEPARLMSPFDVAVVPADLIL